MYDIRELVFKGLSGVDDPLGCLERIGELSGIESRGGSMLGSLADAMVKAGVVSRAEAEGVTRRRDVEAEFSKTGILAARKAKLTKALRELSASGKTAEEIRDELGTLSDQFSDIFDEVAVLEAYRLNTPHLKR
jgi:hypothetical protein